MKKILFFVIFIFLMLALTASVKEPKKIYNLQKAYVFLDESLLISDTDLNCSYFIKDDMPQDIRVVASYQSVEQRKDFSDNDNLIIDKGSKDGMKKGNLLLIISQGKSIKNLGRYFLKKSLAEIVDIYEDQSVIQLKGGCNPVIIGDFAIPFKPEKTLFAKKIDFMLARIPANPVSGNVVYTDLSLGMPAVSVANSQYATVDLGTGVVAKGTFLLICRNLKRDLPPLITGLAIVIHTENTNSTIKILDANAPVRENDQVFVLRAVRAAKAAVAKAGKGEDIPIVETLQVESREKENAKPGDEPQEGGVQPVEQTGAALVVDVLFGFDGKQPKGDHGADFTALKEFIDARSEYVVTLRGYTCSIGSAEYNLRLAQERVEAVKNILITRYGVDAAHVETYFYGEKEPRSDNSSEAERLKNRLVKIEVSGK